MGHLSKRLLGRILWRQFPFIQKTNLTRENFEMLEIACEGVCGDIVNTSLCNSFNGCKWSNQTGLCQANPSGSFSEASWIGIILSLIGNIIIKYSPSNKL